MQPMIKKADRKAPPTRLSEAIRKSLTDGTIKSFKLNHPS